MRCYLEKNYIGCLKSMDFSWISNLKITYLDTSLNLCNDTVSPLRKSNQNPCYFDVVSNHPKKNLNIYQTSLFLSTNLCNVNIFNQCKYDYEMALTNIGYKTKLIYINLDETFNTCNRGKIGLGKILWFTPP